MIAATRQGKIPLEWEQLLRWVFPEPHSAMLGGGCALVEFYLGHRVPDDIDLFFFQKAHIGEFASALAESFDVKEVSAKQWRRFIVRVGDRRVKLHCCRLNFDRWSKPEVVHRFSSCCDGMRVQSADYLAIQTLISISRGRGPDVAQSVEDLACLFLKGVEIDELMDSLPVALPRIQLSDVIAGLRSYRTSEPETMDFVGWFADELSMKWCGV